MVDIEKLTFVYKTYIVSGHLSRFSILCTKSRLSRPLFNYSNLFSGMDSKEWMFIPILKDEMYMISRIFPVQ